MAMNFDNGKVKVLMLKGEKGDKGDGVPSSGGTFTGDVAFEGVVDVKQRRCYATLSAAGWYRAIEYDAIDSREANGVSGEILDIYILWSGVQNSAHHIKLFLQNESIRFAHEESNGKRLVIDKIRYITVDNHGYVDIHFTHDNDVNVEVRYSLQSRTYAQGRFTASSLEAVADAPNGETVVAVYNFSLSASDSPFYGAIYDLVLANDQTHIGFLGDSLTFGFDPTTQEQTANNYPAILQSRFTAYGLNVVVHNYGVSGWESALYKSQFESAVADGCKIVSFSFGSNDFRLERSLDVLLSNIVSFIADCKSNGIVPIVTDIPPYYATQEDRYKNAQLVSNAIRQICAKNGVIFVPLFNEIMEMYESGCYKPIAMQIDGVHFSNYSLSADVFCKYAFPFLVANDGALKNAWRNSGLMFDGTINDMAWSPSGRIANLKGDNSWQMRVYSDKPFDLSTISGDYVSSGLVTWSITGFGLTDQVSIDYFLTGVTSPTLKKRTIFSNVPAGCYIIKMESLVRGGAPSAYTPLLYLADLCIDTKDYLLAV